MDTEPTPTNMRAWAKSLDESYNPTAAHVMYRAASQIERLTGTMRYILAQAKANHPGALAVIEANAELALDPSPLAEAAVTYEQDAGMAIDGATALHRR